MEELQKSVADLVKSVGAMAIDVKTVTGEMTGLRKQLEDFGEDLDGVKRRLPEPDRPSGPPRVEIRTDRLGMPQANKEVATACLMNKGLPLIHTAPSHMTGFHTAPSSPTDGDARAEDAAPTGDMVVRPRRHDFPRFSGDKPLLWIDLCITYFDMYRVPEHHWVCSATLHLEGHAALWFQAYKRRNRLINWDDFMQALVEEFGLDEFDGQMTRIMQLRQTGTDRKSVV